MNSLEWRNEKPQEQNEQTRIAKRTVSSGECLKWQMLQSRVANVSVG